MVAAVIVGNNDMSQDPDYEYIVKCWDFEGSAWLQPGRYGAAWYFEGSDILVDYDEVEVIRKVIDHWNI